MAHAVSLSRLLVWPLLGLTAGLTHAAFHREVIAFLRQQLAPAGASGPSAR